MSERRHRLSASRRKLGRACLYWARADVDIPDTAANGGAELGSALHESADEDVCEDVFRDGWRPGADLVAIAEKWGLKPAAAEQLEAMHAAWRDWWGEYAAGRAWRIEVPYAFDVATGRARELTNTSPRDYSDCLATEVPATVDAVLVDADRCEVTVLDLKTGRPPKRVVDYLDQLAHGALCVARVHGFDRARVVIAHVMPTGVSVDEAELDVFDLDATAAELGATLRAIPTAEPHPGYHCRELFCPARAVCPATAKLLVEVAPQAMPERVRRLPLMGPVEDNAQASALLEGLPLLEAWIEERRKAIKVFADEHDGVQLADGRIYAGRPTKSTSLRLDVRGAEDALREVLGDRADEAITRSLTQTGIERVARRLAQRHGDLARIKGAAIDALRRRGAVKVSEYRRYEVRAAERDLA